MERQPIRELANRLEAELTRMGYAAATLNYYRNNWRGIISHFETQGEEYFSEATAMAYVDSKCSFFEKEKAGKLTQSNMYLFRTIRMLGDFQQHGTVLRRYESTLSRVNNAGNQALLEKYRVYCKDNGYSASTQKSYARTTENFISYMEAHNTTLTDLAAIDITEYIKTLLGYSYKMVEYVLCGTRSFLRFLHHENIIGMDLSTSMPTVQSRKNTRIPSVWDKADLEKLISVIDRGNPSGKRDYAIILIVMRMGIRCIDVKNLTFSNFNWNDNYLEFKQSKTGFPVRLPLFKDVGWAVIDYIKNGRPVNDSPYIFLRHLAPIGPFADEDHLHQMIVKYMRLAKIPISGKKKTGMHSLRHTLATTLLENHEPIERIADILGQQDTNTTAVYLKSSLNLLRECALSPEVE